MLKDLKTITISGGAFERPAQLNNIFANRLNLVYGKNGAGKSTLASAVSIIAGKTAPDGLTASFNVDLTDAEKQEVYVFNEAFVRDNIMVGEKGPANIVMIGSGNIELAKEIHDLEDKKLGMEEELRKAVTSIKNAQTEIDESYASLSASLKDSEYSKRTLDLVNLRGRSQARVNINQSRIEEVVYSEESAKALGLPKEVTKLSARFKEIMPVLKSGSGNTGKVYWNKPEVSFNISPEEINTLLAKKVLKPELTEREQTIFALMNEQERKEYWIRTKNDILEKGADYCPLCHQKISSESRDNLKDAVSRLLNEESNRFERELQNAMVSWTEIQVNNPVFPVDTYDSDILKLNNAVARLNGIIRNASDALNRRKDNMYDPESYRIEISALKAAVNDVEEAGNLILTNVKKYNDGVDNLSTLEKEAIAINNYIAMLENGALCDKYKKAKGLVENSNSILKPINDAIDVIKNGIRDKGSQLNQTGTACKYINTQLANIFYAEDRLRLEPGDGGEYVLHCRGKAVPPEKISTGERNIIALTYFFATLFQNKTEAGKYSSAMLVVIDDPVSSFDYGNRSGIVSFMRAEISKILQGNAESKVLVMSHEINTITDLFRSLNRYVAPKGNKHEFYELRAGGYIRHFEEKDNEYWSMLQTVYKYASGASQDDESERAIGNIMRRVIETYSTFTYQCGFKDMLDKEYVYKTIKSEKQDYYRNFLGRFILDSQSHAGNYNDTLNFTNSLFSREEKIQTARDLLKFLCYLNPGHLEAYLFDDQYLTVKHWTIDEMRDTT